MDIKLSFLGAAQNVTGSRYLLQVGDTRLLVDCGLYQERDFKHRNWDPFQVPPSGIDAVILTHAHLDHCGWLPKLTKDGFKGKVHCTTATADIATIVMLDSAKIQVEDAAYKKKRHDREGKQGKHPAVPLYTVEDAEAACTQLTPVAYETPVDIGDGIRVGFHDAGHILGAAMVTVDVRQNGDERRIIFSGDIGRWNKPILRDPTIFDHADYVLCESTYGNRIHKDDATIPEMLARVVNDAKAAGGKLLIPSFAVERTQELLYHLSLLLSEKKIPRLPVFVDSPMAIRVTEVFRRHPEMFDEETRKLLQQGKHPCDFPELQMTRTVDESKAINDFDGPAIVIAGSGMCTGGRIKHHLVRHIGRPESTILFVGYQAVGTLGRRILEGEKEVRILGQNRAVEARTERINGFSAHADRDELMRWLSGLKEAPRRLFITHGEAEAAASFGAHVEEQKGWPVSVAAYEQEATLE